MIKINKKENGGPRITVKGALWQWGFVASAIGAFFFEPSIAENPDVTYKSLATLATAGTTAAYVHMASETITGTTNLATQKLKDQIYSFDEDGNRIMNHKKAVKHGLIGTASFITAIGASFALGIATHNFVVDEIDHAFGNENQSTETSFLHNNADLLDKHDKTAHMAEVTPGVVKIDYDQLTL